MILEPVDDFQCLDQLTTFARELAPTSLVHGVALHLATRERVVRWLQSLPQADDAGDEQVRVIQCDVPQRVRLFPDDPNCVERSLAALVLLEVIEPSTPRALATVDKPMRHTGLVEQYGGRWHAVDLFPRRNFSWTDLRVDAHNAGSGLLKAWLGKDIGGGVANGVGAGEDYLFGKVKTQKKPAPPTAVAQREQPAKPTGQLATLSAASGAGATANATGTAAAGGNHGSQEAATRSARGDAFRVEDEGRASRAQRGNRDSHDARDEAQRFWRRLGR